jgi:hypothetical protein
MWPKQFGDRLASWNQLRKDSLALPVEPALSVINSWWFNTPWIPYHLHWDEQSTWPDPWQLLEDNLYCPLARGLGILYTIAIINRPDILSAVLTEVGGDNLVLINKKKYILNWDRDQIVNINLGRQNPRRSVDLEQIQQQIK